MQNKTKLYYEQTNNDPNLPFKYYTTTSRQNKKNRNAITRLQTEN